MLCVPLVHGWVITVTQAIRTREININLTSHWTEPSGSVYLHNRLFLQLSGQKRFMNNLTHFLLPFKVYVGIALVCGVFFILHWTCCSVPVSAPWQMYTLSHPSASFSAFCPTDLCSFLFLYLSSHTDHTLSLSALYFFPVFSYYHSSMPTLSLISAITLSRG